MKKSRAIAIVGIGGVLPRAQSLDAFWADILAGHNAARDVPAGRWPIPVEEVYAPQQSNDKVYSRQACLLDSSTPNFSDLAVDAGLVDALDPMFHLALEAGRQAWDDAQLASIDRQRVGVVLGNIALPTDAASGLADELLGAEYASSLNDGPSQKSLPQTESLNRYVAGLPAGLLAKALGLGGGSFALDAACASSLYALKLAADQLSQGRVDAMLAGGLSRPDSLYTQMGFSQLGALSPSGRCAPFDASADGLVVGEGAGIFVLRRLEDAIRDGQHIYAVIRGIGLSNDVGGNLMSPDSQGQLRAMRTAYEQAGWSPADVQLFECHGTGTPIGDAVELQSLSRLFAGTLSPAGKAIVGSVKSNVGHLLTAAGAAATIKVLLAMKHSQLPPTANFSNPTSGVDWEQSPFEVLSEPRVWATPSSEQPRRAAVSAFGFGGINAHVLLEQWSNASSRASLSISVPETIQSEAESSSPVPITVVGMGAHVGPWDSLGSFTKRVLGGDHDCQPSTLANRWGSDEGDSFRGHLIESLEFPLTQFRIPPTELREMLPQQLLMLKVAAEALADAELEESDAARLRTGVFIGIGLDLNTTNFHLRWNAKKFLLRSGGESGFIPDEAEYTAWLEEARDAISPPLTANRTMGALGGIVASRIARAFRIGGPSFTISSEETSGLSALGVALSALRNGEIDTAIVGAVDLADDQRAVMGQNARRPYSNQMTPRPFSEQSEGPLIGEGAVALILQRQDHSERTASASYATIRGFGKATGGGANESTPSNVAASAAMDEALYQSGTPSNEINFIEALGSGHPAEDEVETQIFISAFEKRDANSDISIGSASASVGHTGAASGLVSVAKACLSLHHRVIPGLTQGTSETTSVFDGCRSLTTPRESHYLLHDRADGRPKAMVSSLSIDGNAACVVLESACNLEPAAATPAIATKDNEAVFVVEANTEDALLQELERLREFAIDQSGLRCDLIARAWLKVACPNPQKKLAAAIVADSADSLLAYIDEARRCIESGASSTHESVFFTPHPLDPEGEVAFVYPGSGNHFPSMGRELALTWPGVLDRLERENLRLASQFAGGEFWSRGDLREKTPQNLILSQVWLGSFVSDLLQHVGVMPKAVLGYSLGETTALLATRTWTDRDQLLSRMQESPLFIEQLASDRSAARKVWKLGPTEPCDWQAGVVNRSAAEVREVLKDFPRVYLLIINTPSECVIGGQTDEVQRAVGALACNFWPLEGVSTVHCELAKPVEEAYREFHRFETTPSADIRFYSSASGQAYEVTPEAAAESLLAQALDTVDFSRVVNSAYNDGVRLFIEVGPGASCTRMIGEILGQKDHVARSVCAPGRDGPAAIRRALALLTAHRVPVDLSRLFLHQDTSNEEGTVPEPTLTISLNRPPCVLPKPPTSRSTATDRLAARVFPTQRGATSELESHSFSMTPRTETPIYSASNTTLTPLVEAISTRSTAETDAQLAYVSLANSTTSQVQRSVEFQSKLLQFVPTKLQHVAEFGSLATTSQKTSASAGAPTVRYADYPRTSTSEPQSVVLNREGCLEFAIGSIAKSLGNRFAEVDQFPTRVRLPDEPLMLVDRIMELEGEPVSLSSGRVVTEHDILPEAWYLDNQRIPTCIAVEAGQADLLLSAYLGIDFETRGSAVYRLLDAVVTFHRNLPGPGETIHYDIHIDQFFRQGDTYLFRFWFDATVEGELLLTMRNGCAGFFSATELAEGQGIITPSIENQAQSGTIPTDWKPLVPMVVESFDDMTLDRFRCGDLAGCFGDTFSSLPLNQPVRLPTGHMKLVDRILHIDPRGGKYGQGTIVGEADIHADAWFLTCHFIDDQVMPGTLMYECCLHTLRVYLSRMGWVGEAADVIYEPVPEIAGSLKCRGQVTAATAKVQYELNIKELGYADSNETPYVVADALMYADGKPVVQMKDMSLRLTGLSWSGLEALWSSARTPSQAAPVADEAATSLGTRQPAIFSYEQINAFAVGNPSDAFGDRYRVFDDQRVIARLPGPPFQFLDRITSIGKCQLWQLEAGGEIVAQYDVPPDAWYFASHRQGQMPFSVLLEIALQPCGWLAAYLGSALTSDVDLSFRNLGGSGALYKTVTPELGTLSTQVKITGVANSGGMIIQNYDFAVHSAAGEVYRGKTNFGFFSQEALLQQVGIRDVSGYVISEEERLRGERFDYPHEVPYPEAMLRMVDHVEHLDLKGGPLGLGFVRGIAKVDPAAWFFKAHFHQDPVWPGSLGLESFLQLLTLVANRKWGPGAVSPTFETVAPEKPHGWQYRGQIVPSNDRVTVEASITEVDHRLKLLRADGLLSVDGRTIYQMSDFTIRLHG